MNRVIGAAASAAWISRHELDVSKEPHWYVEITLQADVIDTRLEINIYPEEWGVIFRRGNRVSSIRVTDIPFVHGNDDHRLLSEIPALDEIHALLRNLERRYDFAFQPTKATVRSNLVRATAIVRPWLVGGSK